MTERPHILPPPPGGGALRKPDEKGAAFFDLDRTLIAGSSAFQFGRAAYKAGLVTRRQLATDAWENVRFRLRGSTDAATDSLRERIGEMLTGVRVRDLQRLAPDVLAGVLPRVYPRMLAIAYEHQDAGRPIFICTAASQEMAELMAIVLTFDGAVGSVAEVVDGHYTGRPGGPFTYREGKAQAIRELAEREDIDLAASWAYTDSESDLPMLRLVGNPVAVNPDAELGRVARAEGWEVLRFERLGRRLRVVGRGDRRRGARRPRLRRALPPLGASAPAGQRRPAAPPMSLHELEPEQREIRDLARRVADERIAPHAAAWDRAHTFPRALFAELGELGLMGVCVPDEHGGAGADFLSYVLVLEELSRADAGVGVTVAVHTSACTLPLLAHGGERWVPALAAGRSSARSR